MAHTGFGLDGTNGAKRFKSYFRSQQKGRKRFQWSRNHLRAAAQDLEIGGSSPPPATIKSLEIKRFQGFFLFSNQKPPNQASGILCTKFSNFEG